MSYTLVNQVSVVPNNCNTGYNNSWIRVQNDANREMFAQASYVTNFSDMPIMLSAADVQIGGVEIKDWDSDLRADVTSSDGLNALRVLSQDLESTVDDVTIGDKTGNFATIHLTYSALNVYPVVPSGGYTLCESRTSGNPSFVSKQIVIHNNSNDDINVTLTLTSGMSCLIPVGKNSTSNHIMILNLAVSTVDNYNGTAITFFA